MITENKIIERTLYIKKYVNEKTQRTHFILQIRLGLVDF